MKTNIPAEALPSKLSNPNKLSTTYTTNILFPKLGPAAVNKYVKLCAGMIRDIASAVSLVEKVKDYNNTYKTEISVIQQPEAWLKDRVVFKPILSTNDIYNKVFVAGLSSFNSPAIKEREILPTPNAVNSTEANKNDRRKSFKISERSVVAIGTNSARIPAVTDIDQKDLQLVDGRIISYELTPLSLLSDIIKVKDTNIGETGDYKIDTADLEKALEEQKKAYLLGNIMHGFSQSNSVIADMVDAKIVNTSGSLVNNRTLSAADTSMQLMQNLQPADDISSDKIDEIGKLVDYGFYMTESAGVNENTFLIAYKTNPALKTLVKKYCISKFANVNLFGGKGLPFPTSPVNTHLREWAFQRVERLDITLGEPELRGPFNAESVSPKSKLKLSETFTSEQFDFSENSIGTSEERSNERAVFTSSRFQSALSNMTESGISDDNSFTTDSTLLNTLREQRRAAIDKTLTNISTENENRVVSGSRSISSSSRNYITRGKDAKLATTELSFQVASHVKAEVRLEEVNLVWAPYIYSPFLYTLTKLSGTIKTPLYMNILNRTMWQTR